jgi:Mg-chelatase subunit ChlD
VDRAYEEDPNHAPRAKSFDTVLCLDISDSMKEGGAFEAMKHTAMAFLDGIEAEMADSGMEENVGLVVFGGRDGDHPGRANVLQNLTNDLNIIRERIEELEPGGKSPFVEALLVAMAAFVRKGGIVSVSGEWEVKPRIIFISDGYPTESTEVAGNDSPSNITNVRLSLSRMLISFKNSDSFRKVNLYVHVQH